MSGLVANVDKSKAELSAKNVSNLEVTWGDVVAYDIPEGARFDANGGIVPVDGACSARLKEIARDDGRIQEVYLVQSALQVGSLDIKTASDTSFGASADASLYKALQLKPSVKVTSVSSSSLRIEQERFVGFQGVAIIEWLPRAQATGESAFAKGRALRPAEVRALLQ